MIFPSGSTPSSRSSYKSSIVPFTQASSTALREETYNELHSLYKEYDTGLISRQQFVQSLKDDYAVNLTRDFDKVVTDSNLTYHGMLKVSTIQSLGYSTRRVILSDKVYFDNPHVGIIYTSQQRTTLPNSADLKSIELNNTIKDYTCGNVDTEEFQRFLCDRNIPITDELSRALRERDINQQMPFQRLAKAIYNSIQYDLL